MFDNPEKLFIIMLIALFIFGPQKLIGLGSSMGRAIRDFRGAVRNAQDEFRAAADEVQKTEEPYTAPEPPALSAPDPVPPAPSVPAASETGVSAPGSPDPYSPPSAVDHEGPHSLASEPPAHTVQESLIRKE